MFFRNFDHQAWKSHFGYFTILSLKCYSVCETIEPLKYVSANLI